jgi:hypothetical protein
MAGATVAKALGRIAVQAIEAYGPDIQEKVVEYVSKSTNNKVRNMSGVAKLASRDVTGLAVVAQGAVTAGIPADRVIVSSGYNPPEIAQLRQSLKTVEAKALAIHGAVNDSVDTDHKHRQLRDDIASDVVRVNMLKTLISAFGSLEGARKVQVALETISQADMEWYQSVIANGR